MEKLLDKLRGVRRVTVQENQRVIVLVKGKFEDILGAGEHLIRVKDTRYGIHDLNRPEFTSDLSQALFRERPEMAAEHLTELRTGDGEVFIILRDGQIKGVLKPGSRIVFWTDAGPWDVEKVDVSASLDIDAALARRLVSAHASESIASFEVPEA